MKDCSPFFGLSGLSGLAGLQGPRTEQPGLSSARQFAVAGPRRYALQWLWPSLPHQNKQSLASDDASWQKLGAQGGRQIPNSTRRGRPAYYLKKTGQPFR